jgi:predicted dehydrogenase
MPYYLSKHESLSATKHCLIVYFRSKPAVMSHAPIRSALVSFGISSRTFHAPFLNLLPGFSLDAVVERNDSRASELYPSVATHRSMESLLQDEKIELIVITSPNNTHYPYAKAALEAGKHVVVEKPFTIRSSEALELCRLSAEKGLVCSVYQNRRYVSDFRTMREILQKGLLGTLHTYTAHYDRYRPQPRTYGLWREYEEPGAGVFYDLGPHLIDQALVLFGKPRAIMADVRAQKDYVKVDDCFDLWLDYGFLRVSLHASMLVREMGPRYQLHGTLGSFIKSGEDPQEDLLKAGELPLGDDWGQEDPSIHGLLHTEIDGRLIREPYPSVPGDYGDFYRNIHRTIREGAPLSETPEHGHDVIKMIELALESSHSRSSVPVEGLLGY